MEGMYYEGRLALNMEVYYEMKTFMQMCATGFLESKNYSNGNILMCWVQRFI